PCNGGEREVDLPTLSRGNSADAENRGRNDHQHSLGLGPGWRREGRSLLCFERRGRVADEGNGNRSRAAAHPGELHLPGRYGYRHAARRSASTRGGEQPLSCTVRKATSG